MARILPLLALGATTAVPATALAQSCAMCGSAFGADDPLGRAFSWSILFLMAAPYLVFGSVGGWVFFTYRRSRGRRRGALIDLGTRRPATTDTEGDMP